MTERDHQAKKTSRIVDIVHRLLMGSKVKVTRMATRGALVSQYSGGPMFFISFSWNPVLLRQNLVNLSTGQYWLNFDGQKGMSDREGHGHKAVLYKSHFPPLRHSVDRETPLYT